MKRYLALVFAPIVLVSVAAVSLTASGQGAPAAVKLSFEPLESHVSAGVRTSRFHVRATNRSLLPVRDVRITVSGTFVQSQPAEHYFARIDPGQFVASPQVHEVVTDLSEEPTPLVWHIEYDDSLGNRVHETVR